MAPRWIKTRAAHGSRFARAGAHAGVPAATTNAGLRRQNPLASATKHATTNPRASPGEPHEIAAVDPSRLRLPGARPGAGGRAGQVSVAADQGARSLRAGRRDR